MNPELHKQVEETLENRHVDVELRPYSTWEWGRKRDERCLSIVLPREEALALLPELRHALALPDGLVAFLGTDRWLGEEKHDGVEVVIAEAESQFDIIRIARTSPCNAGLDIEDVVEKLKSYHEAYGISILRATTDTVEFTLYSMPPDLSGFAEDVYDFCGDVEDPIYVVGEVKTLMRVSLWWD